jgi:hypothetical protein
MLEKLKFKSSAEVFDAGYAIPTYDIRTNTNTWRFRGESFTTPRIMSIEYVDVSGTEVPVYPITKLEKYRA